MRAAVYARFSSDLQRTTSIDDQVQVARTYAATRGWTVDNRHVYSDAAISGSSFARPGILAMMTAVATRPLPFDVVLVDDSSRVARDLADAIRFMQQLKFAGVRVVFISQSIDSESEQAEVLAAVHGIVDSLYLKELSKKVKRGLAGQLERGFATGSITYGYQTIPVPDETGKRDAHGRPALLGKRVEINPEEARIIVQIFEWYAAGQGRGHIVERLNRSDVSGPRGRRWKRGVVMRILANEKYTGQRIWGQVRFERQPGTNRKIARPVPRDQWHIQERPDLRIVSLDLWARVQQRRAAIYAVLTASGTKALMRGRNATLTSKYLFSGFLRCATCGSKITIMHGGSKGAEPRYGCAQSWHNGVSTCANRLTIRASLADEALLARLRTELLKPATVKYVSEALASEVSRRMNDRPRLEAEARGAREKAAERLQRLVRAIEDGAPSQTVMGAIREREAELARLEQQLADLSGRTDHRLAVLPTWVRQQLSDLAALLRDSVEQARSEFLRLNLAVTLHVMPGNPKPFYRAEAQADLPWLAGSTDLSAGTVRSLPESDGSSRWGFSVDLPANNGTGLWKRA